MKKSIYLLSRSITVEQMKAREAEVSRSEIRLTGYFRRLEQTNAPSDFMEQFISRYR